MSRNEEAKKDAEQQVSEELANQPKQNSGRDDNSVAGSTTVPSHLFRSLKSCHPDRSVAKWRDLRFSPSRKPCNLSYPSSLVIPTGA